MCTKKLQVTGGLIAVLLASAVPATSETVFLHTLDNSISLSGELLSFDGVTYIIQTAIGELSLAAKDAVCEGVSCPVLVNQNTLSIAGSQIMNNNLLPHLIESFAMSQDLEVLETSGASSAESLYSLSDKAGEDYGEISASSEDLQTALTSLADYVPKIITTSVAMLEMAVPGEDIKEYGVALDALVFVVAPNNPVHALSADELAGIFSGKITNWAELGGTDNVISLYRPDETAEVSSYMEANILAPNGKTMSSQATVLSSSAKVARAVAADAYAIGYTNLAQASDAKILPVRGACDILSYPTPFALKSGEYPYGRDLYVTRSANVQAEMLDVFWKFMQTAEAELAVQTAGFVDKTITTQPIAMQGERMLSMILSDAENTTFKVVQKLAVELRGAQRISTTIRSDYGIANLNAVNMQDIARLARYLGALDLTHKEVLILGFTDSAGSAITNNRLSLKRAGFVKDQLVAELEKAGHEISIITKGYGEASPLYCNASEVGRNINRRVEIWIRDIR
ncbi:MAG: phosphate ABC transporter substrate-binding/OmpA family protein [Paracoccaceae bacterium]